VLGVQLSSGGLGFSGITTRTPTVSEIPAMTATEGSQELNFKPMWESSAIITDRNGTQTTVPADTLRWCISVGESISLDNGYTITLDNIKQVDIVRAAPAGEKTLFSITLLDDTTIEGEALTCSFIGQTSVGRFELWTDQIERVEILRK
jgi:hypothetical protein